MLSYRTFFAVADTSAGSSAIDAAMAQVHAWLKTTKGYNADLISAGSVVSIGHGAEATLTRETATDGSESALFLLREKNSTGTWITQLIVHDPHHAKRQKPWVWLDIDGPERKKAAVPNLARFLLEVLDARDAGVALNAEASSLTADDVPKLVKALVDDCRRGPIFIAGSDSSLPMEPWRELVSSLLNQTTGLAPGYVLDPEATLRFNELVGPTHSVDPGTMRTFALGVDFSSDLDARRHRILSTASIVTDSGKRMVRVLGDRARDLALSQPVPHFARRVERRLHSKADRDFLANLRSLTPVVEKTYEPGAGTEPANEVGSADSSFAPSPEVLPELEHGSNVAASVEVYLALMSVHQEVFGFEEVTGETVQRLGFLAREAKSIRSLLERKVNEAKTLQNRVDRLSEERLEASRRLEDEQLEHADTAGLLNRSEELLTALRTRMQRHQQGEDAWRALDDEERIPDPPTSFNDLLERMSELSQIVWTGDPEMTFKLDVSDPMGRWAAKTWKVLLSLEAYAECRLEGLFSGTVDAYLQDTPPGQAGYSANRHAHDESGDVKANPKYSGPRTLPVPEMVDVTGRVFMGAHFKIAQSSTISPRLHYFDAVAIDGKVYVGYIGPHLPTKKTN